VTERLRFPKPTDPVSDVAWESLVAAVHEEVQHLPDAERTAFALCDLQGVSHGRGNAAGLALGLGIRAVVQGAGTTVGPARGSRVAPMAVVESDLRPVCECRTE